MEKVSNKLYLKKCVSLPEKGSSNQDKIHERDT
jgi:hypothetical protein